MELLDFDWIKYMNFNLPISFIIAIFGLPCSITTATTIVKAEATQPAKKYVVTSTIDDAIKSRKLKSLLTVADGASRDDNINQSAPIIAEICDALSTYEFTDASGHSTLARQGLVANQLAMDELKKLSDAKAAAPIELRLRLVAHLHAPVAALGEAADPAQLRAEKIGMWLTAWHDLEEKLDINITIPARRFTHVLPPPGANMADDGSPDSIKDPVMRKLYEQEIAKANKDADARIEQMQLRSMKQTYQHCLIEFCTNYFVQADSGKNELADLLKRYNINSEDSAMIIQQVEQRRRGKGR